MPRSGLSIQTIHSQLPAHTAQSNRYKKYFSSHPFKATWTTLFPVSCYITDSDSSMNPSHVSITSTLNNQDTLAMHAIIQRSPKSSCFLHINASIPRSSLFPPFSPQSWGFSYLFSCSCSCSRSWVSYRDVVFVTRASVKLFSFWLSFWSWFVRVCRCYCYCWDGNDCEVWPSPLSLDVLVLNDRMYVCKRMWSIEIAGVVFIGEERQGDASQMQGENDLYDNADVKCLISWVIARWRQ